MKTINIFRRRLMQALTRNIGSSQANVQLFPSHRAEIKRILITRPNHRLGNLLLVSPLLQEVRSQFPNAQIDLFVKGGLAPILFRNYENIDRIIQLPKKPFSQLPAYLREWVRLRGRQYDLVINVGSSSSSGRLSTKFARSGCRLFGDTTDPLQVPHFGKAPVIGLRNHLRALGFKGSETAVPPPDLKLSRQELAEGERLLKELVEDPKQTICLFTYATGSKCYSKEWWKAFYARLRDEFPKKELVEVLPVENVSQLDFVVPTFYTRDVRELGAVIANTAVFIGADSGVTHLASAVKTPTVALFSVTDEKKYHPYNEHSIAVNTETGHLDACFEMVHRVFEPALEKSIRP